MRVRWMAGPAIGGAICVLGFAAASRDTVIRRSDVPAILRSRDPATQRPSDPATSGVLVSRQLLESRRLRVGDVIHLSADPSGARPQPFRIDGSYEPTPDPARFAQAHLEARLHLPDLIALTADPSDSAQAGTIGSINVAL